MFILNILLLGLGYVLAAVSGLAALVFLLVGLLLYSKGLRKSDARLGAGALVVFFVALFASIACFGGANGLQRGRDQELIDAAHALMPACNQLGDTQPLPAPGQALVWDQTKHSRSKADAYLRRGIRAGWYGEILVFLVEPSQASYREANVCVVRWPQKEAVGKYTVRDALNESQRKPLKQQNMTLSNLDMAIIDWIDNLPSRSRGDGPDPGPSKP